MSDEPKLPGLMGELRSRGHLPALDANVATISSLAGDPLTCTAELTSVILRDCALTASVISTANSAFYHPAEPVKTVSTAILMMGFEKVQTLAMGLGIVSTRKGADINRILLTGLEAIYRCLRPACALLAFREVSTQHLQGRFYLGPSPTVHACDFLVSLQDDQSPITKCLKTQQSLRVSVPRDLPGSFFSRLKVEAALLVPIVVLGNAIGQCVVGRDSPPAFSQQEEMWVEAVAGHLAMAFERTRAVASL